MSKDIIDKEFLADTLRARQMMAKKILTEDEVKELYCIFQQVTQGNCNDWRFLQDFGSQLFDLQAKVKYNSWNENKGLTNQEAKQKYTLRVNELAKKYCVIFPENRRQAAGSVCSLNTLHSYV